MQTKTTPDDNYNLLARPTFLMIKIFEAGAEDNHMRGRKALVPPWVLIYNYSY
jgi:hypothetical protein